MSTTNILESNSSTMPVVPKLGAETAIKLFTNTTRFFLPRSHWYQAALRFSRLMCKALGAEDKLPNLLHRCLDRLFDPWEAFPIPVDVLGLEELEEVLCEGVPFVCCSTHQPLVKSFFGVLRASAPYREVRAVFKTRFPGGLANMWHEESCITIPVDSTTLVKARTLLKRGGVLLVLTDDEQGVVNNNVYRLARKMGAPVLEWRTALGSDGRVKVRIWRRLEWE